jgi:hypothetical protein
MASPLPWVWEQRRSMPWGQILGLRPGRQIRCRGAPPALGRTARVEWTGPNEGAVKVGKTQGVSLDGVGDAFAAVQPGEDELVGVGAVHLRAGGADGGSAVAAGLVDDAVGHVAGVAGGQDGAGQGGDLVDPSAQLDRAGAGAC